MAEQTAEKVTHILHDNEGRKVVVEEDFYQELKQAFDDGEWAAVVKYKGKSHVIVLPGNFK